MVLNWVHVSLLISKPDIGCCRCRLMMWAAIGYGGLAFCQAQTNASEFCSLYQYINNVLMLPLCLCVCVSDCVRILCIVAILYCKDDTNILFIRAIVVNIIIIHPSIYKLELHCWMEDEWDTRRSDTRLKLLMFI